MATLADPGKLTLRQIRGATAAAVRPDLVSVAWCERVARALAPVRDVSRDDDFTDADLIGTRVPKDLLGGPVEPGRGLLHLGDGQLVAVRVPTQ